MTQQDGPDGRGTGGVLGYEDDPWYDAVASGRREPEAVRPDSRQGGAPAAGAVPWHARPLPPSSPDPSRPAPPRGPVSGPEAPWQAPGGRSGPSRGGRAPELREGRPRAVAAPGAPLPADDARAAVYVAVHRSAAFREVRRRHRRFVFPATALFLSWYLAYLVAATTAPGLMSTPVGGGPVNVGLLAGLGQFLTTALLTCAYACHARLRRDRAALDLRWETQQLTREAVR
ncbi:DUF485 domain-containing protein [Streptomyces chumphonensis]|nr:DUF485 domain-containing protein [Streptomyces chumphonensis]